MRAYQKILPEIAKAGGSLMAISPQTPDKSQATLLNNYLEYEVLSDLGNVVARQFGLVFQVPEWIRSLYISFGGNLPAFNADHSWELPVPGTFLVARDGRILLAHADTDIRNLLEPQEILDTLRQAREESAGEKGQPPRP